MIDGNDRGKESTRETEDEAHGWNQGDGGKREDERSSGAAWEQKSVALHCR